MDWQDFIKAFIMAIAFFIVVALLISIMGIQFPHGGF